MQTRRPFRKRLALWMAAFFLLTQWLTAAYACTLAVWPTDVEPGIVAMATDAAMADCAGSGMRADPAQPGLCKAHCEAGRQSVGAPVHADFNAPLVFLFALSGPQPVLGAAASLDVPGAEAGHGPPLAQRPQVLRL